MLKKTNTHTKFLIYGSALLAFLTIQVLDVDARVRVRLRGLGLRYNIQNSSPVLSREQLRSCVGQQNRLNSDSVRLEQMKSGLKQKLSELERFEQTISQREPFVDRYSQESVDSFNALITNQRKLAASYNEYLPAYNAQVDKYKILQQSFNTTCAGQYYYEDDMQAVISDK